jgi:hypothetical protein
MKKVIKTQHKQKGFTMKNNNTNKGLNMSNNNNTNKGLDMSNNNNNDKGLDMSNVKYTKEFLMEILREDDNMSEDQKRDVKVLRSVYGLPVQNNLRTLQIKAKAVLEKEWTNIEVGDDSLYNGHRELVYFINPSQDIVEPGLPAQINIYCNLDDDILTVAKLAKTYDENDPNSDMEWDDLEEHNFSWEKLSELLVKYRLATN